MVLIIRDVDLNFASAGNQMCSAASIIFIYFLKFTKSVRLSYWMEHVRLVEGKQECVFNITCTVANGTEIPNLGNFCRDVFTWL